MITTQCWAGNLEEARKAHGWQSAEYQRILSGEVPSGTCLLPSGHDGPHEFTDDRDITIWLSEPAP